MENGCDKVIQIAFLRSFSSAVRDATSCCFSLFITEGAVYSSLCESVMDASAIMPGMGKYGLVEKTN